MTKPGNPKEKSFLKASENRGPGRPAKLNQELIDQICTVLRHGAYVETAAAYCGISKDIFYKWLKIGRDKPRSIHGKLVDALGKAMAESEIGDLAAISKHRAKSWQAAAWRLQRRNPQRWAATHRPPVPAEGGDVNDNEFRLNYDLDEDE